MISDSSEKRVAFRMNGPTNGSPLSRPRDQLKIIHIRQTGATGHVDNWPVSFLDSSPIRIDFSAGECVRPVMNLSVPEANRSKSRSSTFARNDARICGILCRRLYRRFNKTPEMNLQLSDLFNRVWNVCSTRLAYFARILLMLLPQMKFSFHDSFYYSRIVPFSSCSFRKRLCFFSTHVVTRR